jgi:ABC-2 type transport system permease protein
LKKEYFSFLREPSQWIHLLVMVVLTGIFALSVSNLNLRLRVTEIQLITYLVLFAFAGFLTCSIALRFLFPMTSMEGKAFWLLRSGPVSIQRVMMLKLALGFLLVWLLSFAVSMAMNYPFRFFSGRRPLLMWMGVYESFWFSMAVSAMNLGLGSYFANYAEKNPIRLASTQGATLTFLTTLAVLILVVALFILPLNSYFQMLFTFQKFDMRLIVVPGTVLAVVSMLLTVFGVHIGFRAVRKDF